MWASQGALAGVDDAGRVRQVPARRHRQVGGRRQADQRERQEVVAVNSLKILSGGAAQGLVASVTQTFTAQTGWGVDGTFGAVGIMAAKLREGAPADVMISTAALIDELQREGLLTAASAAIGAVETSVAVREGDVSPSIGDEHALRDALLASDAIFVPDIVVVHRRHSRRKGAAPARHLRFRCRSTKSVSERRDGHARAGCLKGTAPDRLYAIDRDHHHNGIDAGRASAARVRAGHGLCRGRDRPRPGRFGRQNAR